VGAKIKIRNRYDNFIGGECTAPVNGQYFDNPSHQRRSVCTVARSTAEDIEKALDAAHAAAPGLERRRQLAQRPHRWSGGVYRRDLVALGLGKLAPTLYVAIPTQDCCRSQYRCSS
jgi:hypothetical protein